MSYRNRTLSSIINNLLAAGIQLTKLEEPKFLVGEQGTIEHQWSLHIPRILYIEGSAT